MIKSAKFTRPRISDEEQRPAADLTHELETLGEFVSFGQLRFECRPSRDPGGLILACNNHMIPGRGIQMKSSAQPRTLLKNWRPLARVYP